jgi:hypothetical protein
VNGQTYSYGGTSPLYLDTEPISTSEYSGNAPVRVPYIGYDMNSVLFKAEGISNYNALQLQARKRFSIGLQFTASYTWSHALDEQSGLGCSSPATIRNAAVQLRQSADFDQTHVFTINYSYRFPKFDEQQKLGYLGGWTIGGQTVAQSGQPYSIYDYSGSVASLYLGTSDYIGNPIVPLAPGVTVLQAQLQGTTGVNAGKPVLNVNDFRAAVRGAGADGVPPCDASGCDLYESLYGNSGRNIFRAPFQVRFDMTVGKTFNMTSGRYKACGSTSTRSMSSTIRISTRPTTTWCSSRTFGSAVIPARREPGTHPAYHRQFALPAAITASDVLGSGRTPAQKS